MIESRNRQKKEEMQMQAVFNMVQAKQIAEHVSALFENDRSKVKITPLSTYFPELFSDMESAGKESKHQISKELALNKAKMEEFAFWHNRKMEGKAGE